MGKLYFYPTFQKVELQNSIFFQQLQIHDLFYNKELAQDGRTKLLMCVDMRYRQPNSNDHYFHYRKQRLKATNGHWQGGEEAFKMWVGEVGGRQR